MRLPHAPHPAPAPPSPSPSSSSSSPIVMPETPSAPAAGDDGLGRRHRRRRPTALAAGVALALLVTAAACSGSATSDATGPSSSAGPAGPAGSSSAPTSTSATSAAPTTAAPAPGPTPADDEAAVLAAYQGFIDTWFGANDPPNPSLPAISRYLDGDAKSLLVEEAAKNQRLGVVIRRPANSVTGIRENRIAITGETATIDACVVDDGQVIHAADGLVLNSRVVTRRQVGTLSQRADGWRVVHNEFRSESEGVTQCGL